MATTYNYSTMQALRAATTGYFSGDIAIVDGYYTPYDKGGGTYVWDGNSTTTPNDGTVVAPNNKYSGGSGYNVSGRWFLIHNGVVNVRQFGALGDASGDTIADNPYSRFEDTDELRQAKLLYPGPRGTPFSGLTEDDTIDWCAIQAALIWCGENGARCEAPEGVYKVARPVWLGDDAYAAADEVADKAVGVMGLTFVGQTGNSRQQADGGVANIRLIADCANRYCLSVSDISEEGSFSLKGTLTYFDDEGDIVIEHVLTEGLSSTSTAGEVQTALDDELAGLEVLLLTDPAAVLGDENVYFQILPSSPNPVSPKFLGELLAVPTGDPDSYTGWVHCFPDCAVISFRRSAGVNYRLESITLKGNSANEDTERLASFGTLFVTTQFFGHIIERIEMAYIDTAVGILKGTGNNGEQSRIDRLHALEVRRMLYTNAPQAFSQEFLGWNGHLQNVYKEVEEIEARDLTDLVYAEFDEAGVPGFGANFYNASGTFTDHDNPESDATVVRAKRGTGTVQFVGGRFEHTTRLFNYDAVSGQGINNNMDVVFRGVEFTLVGGGVRRLVQGEEIEDVTDEDIYGTQYGLFVDTCTFDTFKDDTHPEYGDIIFESIEFDKLRCAFQNSRFLGIRSLQQRTIRVAFRQCYKTDFKGAGSNDTPLRQFSDEAPLPGERTQSLRNAWQDTPWAQTGPRVNVLKNSDLVGQAPGFNESSGVMWSLGSTDWSLFPISLGTKLGGFAKWGGLTGGNAVLSDFNPGPESFFVSLLSGTALRNTLSAVDLNDANRTIVTYQALVRINGTVRFALVKSTDTDVVYDETVLTSTLAVEKSPWTLVTLRAQLAAAQGSGAKPMVVIGNSNISGAVRAQVMWQQAWWGRAGDSTYPLDGGLANAGQKRYVSGDVVQGTYPWAVNALAVKASSRFQLPLLDTKPSTGEAAKMGWQSPSSITAGSYDLQDGELYYDDWQASILGEMEAAWYTIHQPDRVRKDPADNFTWEAGREKNILYTSATSKTLNLDNTIASIAPGTIVRVVLLDNATAYSVTVESGTSSVVLDQGQAAEFVFFVDTTGKWLVTQISGGDVLD